jgi:two-component system, NtrC family, sensor kinase
MKTPSQNTNRRVLIIDDNQAIHADFRKILCPSQTTVVLDRVEASLFDAPAAPTGSVTFEVDSAMQGKEGLERVQQAVQAGRPYALAFIDVRMPPGWDGIETTARIWKDDPDLQVVICTAYSDYSWDEMLAKIGQSDRLVILKKPFDNVEVLQLANALSEKWRLLQQTKFKVDDLERIVASRTEELRDSEQRFRTLSTCSPIGIFQTDSNGCYLYVNPRWESITGFALGEGTGEGWQRAIHSEDRTTVVANWNRLVGEGGEFNMEFRFQTPRGDVRWVRACSIPVRNNAGITGHVGTVEDITRRKQTEAESHALELQLRHAQKMESIGQLAAGIAHEINTPTQYIGDNTRFVQDAFGDITRLVGEYDRLFSAAEAGAVTPELLGAVRAAAATADMAYLSAEIPKAIQQSLDGVSRVTHIVRAMKEFSHPGTTEKTAVDLAKTIQSTVTVASNEWKYVADLVTEFDPALPPVSCLPGEFNQVILNLIVNASHAIADVVGDGANGKGMITVSTRLDGDCAEVRIRDTGTGIPEKARAKVFDPFFTTKAVGKGTGQGLAIAHNVIVEKHGGTIHFETETGKGTTFVIRLPLQSASQERKAA